MTDRQESQERPAVESERSTEPETTDESASGEEKTELKHDEVYCTSCGKAIKKAAEICPECGVRQPTDDDQSNSEGAIHDGKSYELQKVARKDEATAVLLGFLISPLGYWYVGRTGLAILNFITFNFLLLGVIVVPIHSYKIINDAQDELERHGVEY